MDVVYVELEPRDYVNAAGATAFTRGMRLVAAALSIAVIFAGIFAVNVGYSRQAFIGVSAWFGAIAGAAIGWLASITVRAKRIFYRNRMQDRFEMTWDAEAISVIKSEEAHR